MKTSIIFLLCTFFSIGAFAQTTHISNAHVGLFYPLSSNGKQAAQYTNRFSLNLFQGISANETGLTISGMVTNVKDSAGGVQVAGLVNTIRRRATGLQIAGVANITGEQVNGLQIAGIANVAGRANGTMIAGFANMSYQDGRGKQLAGFMNRSGNVHSQISGFMNIAKKVKGVQIAGLINIADSSDYPIGIINIIKNGDMSIGVSVDQSLTTLATFRSGGHYLYGIIGAGYNLKYPGTPLYAGQAGIGAHLIYTPLFKLNAEATVVSLNDFKGAYSMQSGINIYPTMRVYKRMEVFAGPSFNYTFYHGGKADVHHHYVWSDTNSRGREGCFVGAIAGVQWTL